MLNIHTTHTTLAVHLMFQEGELNFKVTIFLLQKTFLLGNVRISNFPDTIGLGASPETGHNAGYPTIKVEYLILHPAGCQLSSLISARIQAIWVDAGYLAGN